MVATAIIGAGLLGAGASIVGANKAASAQTKAAKQATDVQRQMFDVTQKNLQPFREAGAATLPSLAKLLNPGTAQSELEKTPGFQFNLAQGLKANTNASSARGLSGAQLKGAETYASGLASNTYTGIVDRLLSMAGLGANAGANVANNATQTGANIGSNITGAGNAQAGAAIAGANAVNSGLSSIPSALLTQQLLAKQGGPSVFSPTNWAGNIGQGMGG